MIAAFFQPAVVTAQAKPTLVVDREEIGILLPNGELESANYGVRCSPLIGASCRLATAVEIEEFYAVRASYTKHASDWYDRHPNRCD